MKLANLIPILAVSAALGLACGGSSDDHHDGGEMGDHHAGGMMEGHDPGMHSGRNTTQIVKRDGVQVAFDLMTADGHANMAKMMKIDMQDMHDTDHHVSLTLMNLETKKVIKDAQDLKITVTGPDGQVLAGGKGHVMAGGGMHHHGIGFSMQGPGNYKVKAEFSHGGKQHMHEAEFDM
ncbi:MAG: hypothetical protein NXI24_25040 [bacterium]|nr:hypothetical protein [bacterium]